MITTTYPGSGDATRHSRDYRPEWLDKLADDATIERSVLTGIAEGPAAIREIRSFARTLYDYTSSTTSALTEMTASSRTVGGAG